VPDTVALRLPATALITRCQVCAHGATRKATRAAEASGSSTGPAGPGATTGGAEAGPATLFDPPDPVTQPASRRPQRTARPARPGASRPGRRP
jgi:hypothetical protein